MQSLNHSWEDALFDDGKRYKEAANFEFNPQKR